ncbi:MAG: hypothetical protein II245_02060 [Bacteroidaceae bacterium]|nr:hypothetical protein [Bacteroidaceae bacterium]
MNPINASSLLHFTKTMDALKGILEKGFRFSYCCEDVSSTINMNELHPVGANFFRPSLHINKHIAIPMICFCDIPLTRAKAHSDTYGKFIVGIDKNMALTIFGDTINPVMYSTSEVIGRALNDLSVIKSKINNVKGCYNYKRSLNQLIGNTKPFEGTFKGKENYCYYDEREWRMLLPYDFDESTKWYWNLSKQEFDEKKNEINKILHHSEYAYRTFTVQKDDEFLLVKFITHIVVDSEVNIPELVNFILNEEQPLFGYSNISKQLRNLFVSRITSFERIEIDY